MKRAFCLLFLIVVIACPMFSQALTHAATLTWTDPNNPTGTSYNIHRAPGLCSGSPVFATLATAVTGLTYTDGTVTPGNYCYAVTAVAGGVESAMSNAAQAPVPSFAPVALGVTVK